MKGYETSKHALACFGGAGPQHACAIARALGMGLFSCTSHDPSANFILFLKTKTPFIKKNKGAQPSKNAATTAETGKPKKREPTMSQRKKVVHEIELPDLFFSHKSTSLWHEQ